MLHDRLPVVSTGVGVCMFVLGVCCMSRKRMCRRSASFDLTSAQDHPNLPPNDSVKTYCCLCHLIYSIGYVLFCCFCCRRKRQCVGNQKKKSVRCPCFRKKQQQQDPEQGVMEVDNGSPERKRSCVYRFCYHPLERFFCWTLYLLTCCCCCWVDTVDEKIEMITITPLDQVVLDPDQTQVKQKKNHPHLQLGKFCVKVLF